MIPLWAYCFFQNKHRNEKINPLGRGLFPNHLGLRNSSGSFAKFAAIRRASSLVSIFVIRRSTCWLGFDWKRPKAGVGVGPSRMLQGRALAAACRAARALAKHVARRLGSPADDRRRARERRVMLAALTP
jgi:hypothetical protein